MDNCGLSKYFGQVIISEEAGFTKPEKEIFLKAMEAAESEPHESIMIGDDLNADVMGALSAGMQAVHFDPNSSDNISEGYTKISQLTELIKMCDPAYSSSRISTR